ncbi:MAG: DUF348 domain-containing protein [Caldilineaceae bacterium]|nr:DUF348 domain-containing protein [Caldilineaceae bacterium]
MPSGVWTPLLAALLLAAAWLLWVATARAVTVQVDGVALEVTTHRRTVRQLLLDVGLTLHANDRVSPGLDDPLRRVRAVDVQRGRPAQIVADGRTIATSGFGRTAREILQEARLVVDHYDQVVIDGATYGLDDPLPVTAAAPRPRRFFPADSWAESQPAVLQMRVVRALPIVVDDGSLPYVIRTTAPTVGEALRQAQITIYLGDRVDPSLGSEVVTGLRVTIQRSKPVSVVVDGRTLRTRTRGLTVGDALAEMRIGVSGMDRVEPPLDVALYDGAKIAVTRVSEEIEVTEEIAPFDTVYVADAGLLIDEQQVVSPGAEGITRARFRVRYENGEEVDRTLEDTWVAQQPAERQIAYGQQIAPQVFTAADGAQITYWRKIRMLASSYSAGTAGVSPSAPNYGYTYSGDMMRFGIVAVDPSIIPLRSKVYVPDYGVGDALDRGSAIRARRIDLGYDDSNLVLWNRWVDVYLLWPPPPSAQITWVLPNWPRVPQ